MQLKITQIAVLHTLAEHKNEWLSLHDILRFGTLKNSGHVKNAVNFFLQHDLVYQPNMEGKIMISPDGLAEISEY
jgi:hypothetical protein